MYSKSSTLKKCRAHHRNVMQWNLLLRKELIFQKKEISLLNQRNPLLPIFLLNQAIYFDKQSLNIIVPWIRSIQTIRAKEKTSSSSRCYCVRRKWHFRSFVNRFWISTTDKILRSQRNTGKNVIICSKRLYKNSHSDNEFALNSSNASAAFLIRTTWRHQYLFLVLQNDNEKTYHK